MENDKENCRFHKMSPLYLDSCSTTNWRSVTNDSFPPLENLKEQIGKRRMLLKKYFALQAAKEIQEEELGDSKIVDSCHTEYIENFCNPDFKPFLDNCDYDVNKQLKYPLYGGVTHSFYKQLMDEGELKIRSSVYNFNHPFRKTCSFTTPPELSLQEIEY